MARTAMDLRVRKTFSRINRVVRVPDLIHVQRQSYDKFLQANSTLDVRQKSGLWDVFKSVFPIKDFSGKGELEFVSYELEAPKYDVEECQQRGMTFAAPLHIKVALVNNQTGEASTQEVYMGDFPLMTDHGTFVINGAERGTIWISPLGSRSSSRTAALPTISGSVLTAIVKVEGTLTRIFCCESAPRSGT